MFGGERRAIWLTTESPPETDAFHTARMLERTSRPAHLVWNPTSGQVVQMFPATVAGTFLKGSFNREGDVLVQIAVVGWSQHPFTDSSLLGLNQIFDWLESWSVPNVWPAGPPVAASQAFGHHPNRLTRWGPGGHYGLSQSPGSVNASPGAIDIYKIGASDEVSGAGQVPALGYLERGLLQGQA